MRLAETIAQTTVPHGDIALFYLAQAGFCIKTSRGIRIYIDPYLTDCCERLFGFKRRIPALIAAQELDADIVASTHAHADHLDPEALPIVAQNPKTLFLGAPDCRAVYRQAGLPEARYMILSCGDRVKIRGVTFRAIWADHGDLAPDAVGLLLCIDGITVYHTGDTALCPDQITASLGPAAVDAMIAPINGQFGNLTASEACKLAAAVKPRVVIASHFGMFAEHGGDPGQFLEQAKHLPAQTQPRVLGNGEGVIISRRAE